MIPFNIPPYTGREDEYVLQAIHSHKICGDGAFTQKCHDWLARHTGAAQALLTTSGSSALDMAAILCGVGPGDEVILPSYTFSATANAFVLAGATPVFVDIRPDTMNIDETLIEDAVTDRTRAICPVHYAGVGCEMDQILAVARRHGLKVIEDAAQGVMASYKGQALGSIGDYGCFSFHESKNYSMGEGGAILLRQEDPRAEMVREKGTNRARFLRGQVDKYTWEVAGTSFLPSELNAAYLWGQLELADQINAARLHSWQLYYDGLAPLARDGHIELPYIPDGCVHNGHMFYIKTRDLAQRTALSGYLKQRGIGSAFHYVPLHSAAAGLRYGRFHGEDKYTTRESERLLRLPMYYGLTDSQIAQVVEAVTAFYRESRP